MCRRITGRMASGVVALMLCTGVAFGQMSPEEAQRQLEEKQQQQRQIEAEAQAQTGGQPVPGSTDTPAAQWPLVALRSGGYLCQFGEQVFCNANYDSRFAKTCRRMIGKAAQPVRNSFKIKLGDIETPLNNYRNVKRTPIFHEIVHQRSEDEQFAQAQAIGQPVVDEFGFIHHARVAQVVDDQTLWLDQICVLPKPDFQAEYKKQTELGRYAYYGTWHDPRYDLQAVIRNTVKVPNGSYFRESLPTSGELYAQRGKMIDWEYESQQALLPIQQMWNNHRIKLVGVPTATFHAGQRWEGADTQIAIVNMEGQNPLAVPSLLLAKPMARDAMIAFMQKRGFTPESMTEVVRKITANRVVGQSPERRIALMLAGRPLPEDAAFLPGHPTATPGSGSDERRAMSDKEAAVPPPPISNSPAPGTPAIDKSLLFDMPAALQNMVRDTVGDQNRQIDNLLASVFDDWWQSHQKGQTIEISGVFLDAARVEPRTYLTRHLIIREDCSKARFAVGTMILQPDQRTYGVDDIPVGPYQFKVIVYALFTGENKMAPLKLQIPDNSRPMPETIVRGSVIETRFTPNGTFELYLNDCQLPR